MMQFTQGAYPQQKPESRFKTFFRAHKKLILAVVVLLVIFTGSLTAWILSSDKPAETADVTPTPKVDPPVPTELPSLLNGVVVSRDIYNRHPVAVMIENSTAARPQAGLTSADIVYEIVTEGGITRFMGVFGQTLPAKAGPVRSARSYFIDYLSEYDAFYAHAGGSPTALARIGEYKIKDYPHSSDAYWREPKAGVASEHTLFTDVSKIFKFGVEKKGWSPTSEFKPWLFKKAETPSTLPATININFSSAQFAVKWVYDPATNSYAREMAGVAHKDRVSGEQIKAKTIVAISVSHSPNAPYKGTGKESEWSMSTIGEGKGAVYQDGLATEATWKKPSRTERTRFYDLTGKEIELNPGKIWIEVVPQDGSYSQS